LRKTTDLPFTETQFDGNTMTTAIANPATQRPSQIPGALAK